MLRNILPYKQSPKTLLNYLLRRRPFSSSPTPLTSSPTPLPHRSVISLSGPDAHSLLQGLITNDLDLLSNQNQNHPLIYTLLLNHQGRVLFDTLIFKRNDKLYLECDAGFRTKLVSHLKLYKLKRRVEVCEEKVGVAVGVAQGEGGGGGGKQETHLLFPDPRLPDFLPNRVYTFTHGKESTTSHSDTSSPYTHLRYTLGIPEGPSELPFAQALPLESNGDLLQGISFDKGCYLGQELTARTFHTGVVRKRIVPVVVGGGPSTKLQIQIPLNTSLLNATTKKPIGKLRSTLQDNRGLALVRLEEAFASKLILIENTEIPVQVVKPDWWPEGLLFR